jgi:hypothetical protein
MIIKKIYVKKILEIIIIVKILSYKKYIFDVSSNDITKNNISLYIYLIIIIFSIFYFQIIYLYEHPNYIIQSNHNLHYASLEQIYLNNIQKI